LGVPKGVLPAENEMVSLPNESAVFDKIDSLVGNIQPFSRFNDGENESFFGDKESDKFCIIWRPLGVNGFGVS